MSAASLREYLLICGGFVTDGGATAAVDAYNSSLVKTIPTTLTKARSAGAAATIGNYAFIAGGETYTSGVVAGSDVVDIYNSALVRLTPMSLSAGRASLAAAAIGNFVARGGIWLYLWCGYRLQHRRRIYNNITDKENSLL